MERCLLVVNLYINSNLQGENFVICPNGIYSQNVVSADVYISSTPAGDVILTTHNKRNTTLPISYYPKFSMTWKQIMEVDYELAVRLRTLSVCSSEKQGCKIECDMPFLTFRDLNISNNQDAIEAKVHASGTAHVILARGSIDCNLAVSTHDSAVVYGLPKSLGNQLLFRTISVESRHRSQILCLVGELSCTIYLIGTDRSVVDVECILNEPQYVKVVPSSTAEARRWTSTRDK